MAAPQGRPLIKGQNNHPILLVTPMGDHTTQLASLRDVHPGFDNISQRGKYYPQYQPTFPMGSTH